MMIGTIGGLISFILAALCGPETRGRDLVADLVVSRRRWSALAAAWGHLDACIATTAALATRDVVNVSTGGRSSGDDRFSAEGESNRSPELTVMTPTNHDKSSDLYPVLAGMGLVGLVAIVLVVNLLRLASELGPHVGDIISFDPTRMAPSDTQARITAMPIGGGSAVPCVLDVRVLQASGGSLLIETVPSDPNRRLRVHWIGARTSDGGTDCGTAADLLLSRTDIAALNLAARGPGFIVK